jgi:SAM-dependent methyltransferase
MTVPTNWYEDFFHGVSLDLWRKAISPQQTAAEADFLVKVLGCNEGSNLLDVPCGNGRLSLELGRRGYRVTGVDIAQSSLKRPEPMPGVQFKRVRSLMVGILTRWRAHSQFGPRARRPCHSS